MDLNYDPDQSKKPRPIASLPFGMNTGAPAPGFTFTAPDDPSFTIPTPMGWLSPDRARQMLNGMAPSREAIADTLGIPMDGMAWAARNMLGAKGIQGDYGKPDPLTQMLSNVLSPGMPHQPMWKLGPDVPFSSQNILRLLDRYVPSGGLF